MNNTIKIGVIGYGNLGRGVEKAVRQNEDIQLEAIFTRRDPAQIDPNNPKLVHISKIESYKGKIDVMILCGGSANDLTEQGPAIAAHFNTIDSFDTHARIPEYFDKIDSISKEAKTVSLISTGWDPGLFSLNRLLGESILPKDKEYTFWGKGVSQGHSDAIRRVEGVKDGIQYTIPIEETLKKVRSGENRDFTTKEKHQRLCYVVPKEGADLHSIEESIKNMPNYFVDYDTVVNFISEKELKEKHSGMPHGGFVICSGETEGGTKQIMEFSLKLESNPEFTSSVLVAYARAVNRFAKEGRTGAITVFDVPFAYLSPKSGSELRKRLL